MRFRGSLERLSREEAFHAPFLAAASLLTFLGRPEAFVAQNYDGAYYAQKAKEMLASGRFWVVTHHGEPSFDNAPLPFWLMAAAYRALGVSDYAAVLPVALFGMATVLLTRRLAREIGADPGTALLAGLVLLFPGYFLDMARRPMLDVVLTGWVTGAMLCFARGLKSPRWYLGFGLCTGLAILTKSVLGAFPLLVGLAYAAAVRRDALRSGWLWWGAAIALCLGGSWHAVSALRFGSTFWDVHFGWLILERGLRGPGDGSGAGGPLFFLATLRLLAGNYWPWLPFALLGAWRAGRLARRDRRAPELLLLFWAGIVLCVMSASRSQMLRYVLPAFPALALLTAGFLGAALRVRAWLPSALAGGVAAVALFIAATPIPVPQAVSLSGRGADVKRLAPLVRLNTLPQDQVGNYRLPAWNPRNAVLFYADRYVSEPVEEPLELILSLEEEPGRTWLTRASEYARLQERYPRRFRLIQSTGRYAYFTAVRGREDVRYDLP